MCLKEKLKSGEIVSGFWVQSGSPVAAEIFAATGADFIVADMEHGDIDGNGFTSFVRSLQGRAAAFARVRENDPIIIRRALDSGAKGIIVPLIDNAQDAKKAVEAALYPPKGIRGYAYCHANGWGRDFAGYSADFNGQVVLIVMIETARGVENINEILSVDGIDGVLIGPYDLSGSYGMPGRLDHPMVLAAMDEVLQACKRNGCAAGQHIVNPSEESVKLAIQQGYTLLPLGMDTVFLSAGAARVKSYLT